MDSLEAFKANQREAWASFAPIEQFTATTAPELVRFARVTPGSALLDVGCGTGVVALTAARLGAKVTGVDLTPELLTRARQNAALMQLEVDWHVGDVEALPLPDASFDFVVSQFGHMFAPRPAVAVSEMLRVLKPGGTIAFSTWPPDLFVGRWFQLLGKYGPSAPEGVSPPPQWGNPNVVRERLGHKVRDLVFTHRLMRFPVLSVQHYRAFMEANFGPAHKLLKALDASDPVKAHALREEAEELAAQYFEDNILRQDYLIARGIKV
ncbi:MAG: methyltransferase domain-containing protein [Polyangiaceae bacterium]